MPVVSISECLQDDAILATHRVMQQLRPHHSDAEAYVQQVRQQQDAHGFRLVAAWDSDGSCLAVAGFRIETRLHTGKMMYVADLVSASSCRSHGIGRQLLTWLKEEALCQGCTTLMLDSGTQRHGAHAFYLREGLYIAGYAFACSLADDAA